MAQLQWIWPGLKGLVDQPRRALEALDVALDKLQRRLTEPEEPVQLIYGTTVTPNMSRGVRRAFKLTVTNGVAFAIARPSQGHNGAVVTFDVFNGSGGAMGAVTWAAEYVFLTAWASPAAGLRATVTFYKAGSAVDSNWIELAHEPVVAGGGAGEANTASNVNAGGVGVWKQKVGVDLQFRGVNAGSSKVTVALDAANNEIDVDVVPADADLILATQVFGG